ncbi:hypothetical protein NQ317_004518 [Molorchus minor]|uniref:DUF4485 domain-containing protein n=1 Tax=Molorchus minor TaxID=1323400 RepID=A0ABQ9JXM1_9CUCU|nr:hypothetical protein NQ317_004518 [Molorchus minor]
MAEEEAPAEDAPAPESRTSTTTTIEKVHSRQDPLHTEFLYYSAALRILGPTLSNEADRAVIIPWVRKLFRPEYHSSKLREKRTGTDNN